MATWGKQLKLYCSIFLALTLSAAHDCHAEAFKLITVDTASLPERTFVAGIQELGFRSGSVFVDTNPALDLLATGNVGAKVSFELTDRVSAAVGARYFQFFGSSAVNRLAIQRNTNVERFDLNFKGYSGYLSSSVKFQNFRAHLSVQNANLSGSKVLGAIFAIDYSLNENWLAVFEMGYEFENRDPRISVGVVRTGPSFGTRLGVTYLDLKESFVKYGGPVPLIDFYWLFGGGPV